MKKIVFHPHALYKMGKRAIDTATVINALNFPDNVKEGRFGRQIAQKIRGEYLLRIIYEEDVKHIVVITAYLAKKRRYFNG